jgi:hypothetical protein
MADFFGINQNSPGNPLSNRNYIVDGNFESWIGSGIIGSGTGVKSAATMYNFVSGISGTVQVNQGFFSGGEPVGMTSPVKYVANHNQTVASTGTIAANTSCYMSTNIEDAHTLHGRSATFSCWLQLAAGSSPVTIPLVIARQTFGTGGSPSVQINADTPVNWVVTTTMQRFSVRIDLPSVSGKTFGTNNDSLLQVGFWMPPGVVFSLYTAQWQAENCPPGAPPQGLPTPFEYRGQQAELARVQRYYETGVEPYSYANNLSGITSAYGDVVFAVQKRSSPAMTLTSWKYYSLATDVAFTPSVATSYLQKFSFQGSGLTNWTGWDGAGIWAADARL